MPIRTEQQHKALFKYFEELAKALNEAGVDQKLFLERLNHYEVPITKEFLHEVWKTIQSNMYNLHSTKQLSTSQVADVYDVVNKFVSEEWGLSTVFPSIEELQKIQQL